MAAKKLNGINGTNNRPIQALIVDDDVLICDYIKVFSEKQGFETTILSKPEAFESIYNNARYQLIVLDLNMPQIDGIQLIRFLSEQKSNADIILVSAVSKNILFAAQDLALNQNLNVLGTLNKPIAPDTLDQLLTLARERIIGRMDSELQPLPLFPEGSNELPSRVELITAIVENQIDVYFQPKIQLPNQTFSGAEALARWNHPEKGTIPPDYFIPFAERHGLIGVLTTHIIERTCHHVRNWPTTSAPYQVSINLSERNLDNLNFPDVISNIVAANGLSPTRFILEVTETTLSSKPTNVLDVLTRLCLRGFDLSIDDFGTGHSSLARLRQVPFSEMKIDKSFVGESDINKESRIIVKNTIELANSLGLSVVAEGAENDKHLQTLLEFGCDKVQGFYFAPPLKNDDFVEWMTNWLTKTKPQT